MASPCAAEEAFIPETLEYGKRKAKHLRSAFPHLSLGRAQQITAKAMGHSDWHARAWVGEKGTGNHAAREMA